MRKSGRIVPRFDRFFLQNLRDLNGVELSIRSNREWFNHRSNA